MYDRISLVLCPCCGSKAEFVENRHNSAVEDERMDYHVECLLCGLRTRRFDSKTKAANAWNTRTQSYSLAVKEELVSQNKKLWNIVGYKEKYKDNDQSYVG